MIKIYITDATEKQGAGITVQVEGEYGSFIPSGLISKPKPSRTEEALMKLAGKIVDTGWASSASIESRASVVVRATEMLITFLKEDIVIIPATKD